MTTHRRSEDDECGEDEAALDGLFDTPEDDPAKWLCMLTLRIDESVDDATGMCIVAGLLGDKDSWKKYVRSWRESLRPRTSLHVSELRLNSPRAPKRYGDLLNRLGPIPKQCGLRAFSGSICKGDYLPRVSGTALEVLMEGYALAILALMDEVGRHLLEGERVQVFFEERIAYAVLRDRAMSLWRKLHKTPSGWSVLAQWGVIPKGTLTEASDYLCYAIQQREIDPKSQKAILTAPILLADEPIRNHTDKKTVHGWLDKIHASRRRPVPLLTPHVKKVILQ